MPTVGMVLGSGLGDFADTFENARYLDFKDTPGMSASNVIGHKGRFVAGNVKNVPGLECIAMQGRIHMYEGHAAEQVVLGVRAMISLGARTLVITNAAGGIDPSFSPGDLMALTDHLNLTGRTPLLGHNDDALGPRFPDMTRAYDRELRDMAHSVAGEKGWTLREGIYAGCLGPQYETPAEVRMLRTLGASAVGMSTVLETIAARHMGARVLGVSCITNAAAAEDAAPLSHDEVTETAARAKTRFVNLLEGVARKLAQGNTPRNVR